MAAKVKMLTLLQGIRGFAQITNRRPPPRSPGLFLAQIRSQGSPEAWRKRKLNITIDQPGHPDIPHQVRIHHVKQGSDPAATRPAP